MLYFKITIRTFICFSVAVLCFLSTHARSVAPSYYFEALYTEEGLAFNPISAIVQDHKGFMWVGTSGYGLYRYDGYAFKKFDHNPFDSTSLPDNKINALLQSPDNRLWIATANEGLVCYDHKSGAFSIFKNDSSNVPYPQNIVDLAMDNKGRLWLATKDSGLYYKDANSPELRPYVQAGLPIENAFTFYANQPNEIIMGGLGSIRFLRDGHQQGSVVLAWEGKIYFESPVTGITKDETGMIWAATSHDGIFIVDPISKTVVNRFFPPGYNTTADVDQIHDLYTDSQQRVWVLTRASGAYVKEPGKWQFTQLLHDEFVPGSISDDRCYTMFEDKNRCIWLGTYRGMNRYSQYRNKFGYYYYNPKSPLSLSDNFIYTIYQHTDGRIFTTTRSGMLNIIDQENQRTVYQPVQLTGQTQKLNVFHIWRRSNNTLWLATTRGLVSYNIAKGTFKRVALPALAKLDNIRLNRIIPINDTLLGIASVQGLYIYNQSTQELSYYKPSNMLGGASQSNYNRLISHAKTPDGNLWFATGQGLLYFNLQERKFYFPQIKDQRFKEALLNGPMISLTYHQGRYWAGSFNLGMYALQVSNGYQVDSVEQFTTDNGLPNNAIYAIVPDTRGQLWLSTNKGLAQLDPQTRNINVYDQGDGLHQNEFNMYAYFAGANGTIFMGGINGLNVFDPLAVSNDPYEPNVVFTDLIIMNRQDARQSARSLGLESADTIKLAYYENYFNILFTSDHYSSPEFNRFEYKLEGFDDTWISPKHAPPIATYTNLPAGKYLLKVRATNPDGVGGQNHATLHIYVSAPYYNTLWFRLLVGGTIVLMVLTWIWQRVRRQRRAKAALEKLVNERTEEVTVQNQIIEAQNRELRKSQENLLQLNEKKDFIFSILSHDLRSPLTTLKGFLTVLIQSVEVFEPDEIVKVAGKIRNSVSTSLDLIDNILFWSQSQLGSLVFKPELLNVSQLARKAIEIYILSAEKKEITLSLETEEDLFVNADENMVFFIIRNLISNALKFTYRGGYVKVLALPVEEEDLITLVIEDSGVGIAPEELERLFNERRSFTKKGTQNEKGTGLGLVLVKRFVETNNGKISVDSTVGQGTRFTVTLPAGKFAEV